MSRIEDRIIAIPLGDVVCAGCSKKIKRRTQQYRRVRARFCSDRCRRETTARLRPNWGKPLSRENSDRFWEKVDRTGRCWLWTASTDSSGYGLIGSSGKLLRAHRVSWEFHFGPIPDGLEVLHTCDVPACVQPDHLFLGTQPDNIADMVAKGRARGKSDQSGEKNHMAKLTAAQIVQIRISCEPQRITASRFGVSQSLVSLIKLRRIWNDVD